MCKNLVQEKLEYDGTREFSLPFPTRGLYTEREECVNSAFREELNRIVSGYKEHRPYMVGRSVLSNRLSAKSSENSIFSHIDSTVRVRRRSAVVLCTS